MVLASNIRVASDIASEYIAQMPPVTPTTFIPTLLRFPPSLLRRIDEYQAQHSFKSRAEAVRNLCEAALEQKLNISEAA